MEKFRFGTKETIATILGLALFVIAEWLEVALMANGIIPANIYEWVQPRVLVVAAVAVFFGPVAGVFCGVGGDLLINVMFESVISYPEILVLGIYGFFMGLYYGRMHYDPAKFSAKVFADFNIVQVFAGIFCAMFFIPLSRFFLEDKSIYEGIAVGARSVVGNSLLIGIIVPIAMAVVAAVKRRGSRTQRT